MFATVASLALLALPLVAGEVHNIKVGGPGVLAYDPPFITAAAGDTLHFTFLQKNHTVTQSSFAKPCEPFVDATGAQSGFKSGFQPVPDTMTDGFPTCDWVIKSTAPLWVYCGQTNPVSHCGKGMVFAVNPPATGNTFDAYKANAVTQDGGAAAPSASDPYGSAPAPAPSAPAPSGSATPPATPPATGSPAVHTVTVGGTGILAFNPPRVDAAIGDIVSFVFKAKNHTVTQSTFAAPCAKVGAPIAGTTAVMDSGFQPSNDTGPAFPTYNVTVQTTSPLWFYCAQGAGAHCAAGMVFAINSVESSANNYAAFVAKAKGASASSGNSTSGGAPAPNGVGRLAVSAGTGLGVVAAVLAMLL
jgi:plastocyanin